MKKVLEVKNISKIYKIYKNNIARLKEIFSKKSYHKEFVANKDISFDLFEGETLGIIGVNGAGKSTILKIVAGVIEPSAGEVIHYGRITALLELGTGFNPELTGYENIFLNGTLIGMTHNECEEKAKDIIEFSELGDYIYEPILTYSSGMNMRLAFSIAIFSEPQVLIVDEALSVGDAHFGAKCTKALKERKKRNMSIIYVSHDLNSLKLLCDRVILLNHGEVVKEGSAEDVINSYNFLISKLNDSEEKLEIKDLENSNYGTYDAEITDVEVAGSKSGTNVISSGETTDIKIYIKSNIDLDNVNIGIIIRDKFGQDIFGTNLFHHNKLFSLKKGLNYLCTFSQEMNIGAGKYSISSAIVVGDTHLDYCLNWVDNVGSFEVAGTVGEFFIGMTRLVPKLKVEMI